MAALTLTACQICPEKPPVIQYEYIVKQPPAEFLEIPAYPTVQLTEHSMQSDIAEWILDLDLRAKDMELKLIKIKEFFQSLESDDKLKAE